MPSAASEKAAVAAQAVWDSFGKLYSRFHWTSVLAAVLIAFLVWAWRRRREPGETESTFFTFL